jgi:hypothetical protein
VVVRRGLLFGAHTVAVPGPAVESGQAGAIRLRMASAELEHRFGAGRNACEATEAAPAPDARADGDDALGERSRAAPGVGDAKVR